MGNLISILAIDAYRSPVLENVVEMLGQVLPRRFELITSAFSSSDAYDPRRHQHLVSSILAGLVSAMPPGAEKVIAVTDVDLCTPVLSFVFGAALLDGSAAVVSVCRLRPEFHGLAPDETQVTTRLFKECLHELGHCFGLYHCDEPGCAMFFSSSVLIIDFKDGSFCPACCGLLKEKMRKEQDEKREDSDR